MMKRLGALILALALALVPLGAYAALPPAPAAPTAIIQPDEPQAEQTTWFYRVYEGRHQKRLWSITYGYWKTDWIDC